MNQWSYPHRLYSHYVIKTWQEVISMSIIIQNETRKAQISEGMYDAVISDVVEANGIATQFGLKDMIIVTFNVDDANIRRRYNKSLHPKSSLYGLIKELNGGAPGSQFDVETLKDTKCRVVVVHRTTETGDVWANVDRVMKETGFEANPFS